MASFDKLLQTQALSVSSHRVLRNTYFLLSLTLLFSAACALFATVSQAPYLGVLPVLVGYFAFYGLIMYTRNSAWSILWVFALTGLMGYTLGPILNFTLTAYANGGQIIATAVGGTGLAVLGLSAYALATPRDLSGMGSFLSIGLMTAFIASLAAIFFKLTFLQLTVSALFMFLSAGVIAYQTQAIVRGGETNYVLATVTLYVSIFNLFISLLQLLTAFSNRE